MTRLFVLVLARSGVNNKGGIPMPHISIKMYPGRDEKTKKELAEKTQAFFAETMGMEGKYFSVSVEEIKKENWEEEVIEAIDEEELYIKANF